MKNKLINILKDLEKVIPPTKLGHYAITYARYGNDIDGCQDELALQINDDGKFYTVFLDENDFDNPELIKNLQVSIEDIRNNNDKYQLGVSGVQYHA